MKKEKKKWDFNWRYKVECYRCGRKNSLKETHCGCGEEIEEYKEAIDKFKFAGGG